MSLPSGAAVLARLRAELPAIRRWGTRGFWAVTDQALFAGTNFLVNVLLARWLEPAEYGTFALALSWYSLTLNFYNAALGEPAIVYHLNGHRIDESYYVAKLLRNHIVITAVLSAVVAVILVGFLALRHPLPLSVVASLSIVLPLLLLLELSRRIAYAGESPPLHRAAIAASIYAVAGCVTLFALSLHGLLTAEFALLTLGLAAALACASALPYPKGQLRRACLSLRYEPLGPGQLKYSVGLARIAVLQWLAGPAMLPVVGIILGPEAAATAAIAGTLFRPCTLLSNAVARLSLPYFCSAIRQGRVENPERGTIYALATAPALATCLYTGALALGLDLLVPVVFGRSYGVSVTLVLAIGASTALSFVLSVAESRLKAELRLSPAIRAWGWGAIVRVPLGSALILPFGLEGAYVAGAIVRGVVCACLFRSLSRRG